VKGDSFVAPARDCGRLVMTWFSMIEIVLFKSKGFEVLFLINCIGLGIGIVLLFISSLHCQKILNLYDKRIENKVF
jgi:hypothetical protein